MWGQCNITEYNSSFHNSEAGNDGGVTCGTSSSNVTVYNSSFNNSKADGDGGVIFATYRGNIKVYNGSFNISEAGNSGGVMSVEVSRYIAAPSMTVRQAVMEESCTQVLVAASLCITAHLVTVRQEE